MTLTITKPRHHWTEQDNEMLRTYYDGSSEAIDRLAHLLNLTREAVKQRATHLFLTRSQDRHVWSPERVAELIRLTTMYSPKKIAQIMGVTENAVHCKQQKIKVSSWGSRGWYNLEEIRELFTVSEKTVHKWISSGKLKACRYGEKSLILQITPKSLRSFVIANPIELQGRKVDMVFLVDLLTNYKAND